MAAALTTWTRIEPRDSIRGTDTRLDSTNVRLDRTSERLDRVVAEPLRHTAGLVALEEGPRGVVTAIGELRASVDCLESRVDLVLTGPFGGMGRTSEARPDALEMRVHAIEKKVA